MQFDHCCEEVEFERALWDLLRSYPGRDVPEVYLSSVLPRSPFHLFYLLVQLDYWCRAGVFECNLHTHQRPLMVCWHKVEIFAISAAYRPEHYVMAPSWWCAFKGHCLFFVVTPSALSYHSHNILRGHARRQLIWHIAMLEFSVFTFKAILCLARDSPVSAGGGYGSPWYLGFWYVSVASIWRL